MLRCDERDVLLNNRKAQALLVYLALTGQPQSRTHLATLLWGDRFEDQARSSLRQALYALRKAVGEGVVLGDDRLSIAEGRLELASGDGKLLDGFETGAEAFDAWLANERLARAARTAETLFEAATVDGADPDAALASIRKARALEPLDERMARVEIDLLAGLGRRSEAMSRYSALCDMLKTELGVAPEAATQDLAERIKDGVTGGSAGSSSSPIIGRFQMLVAPFEDLGGGDTATFLARDLPGQIFHGLERDVVLRAEFLPGATGARSQEDLLTLARKADGIWLLTGTTRQIGTRVRVALTATDVASGAIATVETLQIDEAEAFDLLDRIGDVLNTMWRARANRLGPVGPDVFDRLHAVADQPMLFENIIRDVFVQTFYIDYTRDGLARFNDVIDYALTLYPRVPFFNTSKGWVLYTIVDLGDARTRVAGYQQALEHMNRALALAPGLDSALLGTASISYWLGDFETCDRALDEMTLTAEAFPTTMIVRGNSLVFRGQVEEGLKLVAKGINLGRDMKAAIGYWFATQGLGHFAQEHFEDALASAWNSLETGTPYWVGHIVRIAALARLGRLEECPAAIAAYHAEYPDACVSELDWMPFTNPTTKADFLGALREAGLPE